jgi:hypothetical protein
VKFPFFQPNDLIQQSSQPVGRNTTKSHDAGPVCCSGWFGPVQARIPLRSLLSSPLGRQRRRRLPCTSARQRLFGSVLSFLRRVSNVTLVTQDRWATPAPCYGLKCDPRRIRPGGHGLFIYVFVSLSLVDA